MAKKELQLFEHRFWGLHRPAEPAPASRPPPPAAKKPSEGSLWHAGDGSGNESPIRFSDGPVEVKGNGDWRTVARRDLGDLSWGRVLVSVQGAAGTLAISVETLSYVEVRILQYTNGIVEAVFEGAASQRADAGYSSSAGPVAYEWETGEIPDAYEVQARARRGGGADTGTADNQALLVSVAGRFHR